MGREPKLIAVVGKKGVGKTYTTNKMMRDYVKGNPAKGVHGRRVLILDVNDEYTDFKAIALQDVQMFSVHPRIEVRRVRPFHANGKKMTLDDLGDALFFILENYRNGMLLIEDVNKYISDTMPNDLVGAICTNRHIGLDIVLHYQSIGRITTKVWQNLNILRFHKCTDTVEKHRKKFDDKFEYLYLAQSMINYNYYKLDNKRYFLYIDIDDEKIKGNYTDKLFDIAVDEFINKNYNDTISPLLRSRDSSGKRNHTSQSATDVVKGRLQLYRG
jgi:hypothetical protein